MTTGRKIALAFAVTWAALALVLAAALRRAPSGSAPEPHKFGSIANVRNWGVPSWGNGKTLCLDPQQTFCATSSDSNDCSCGCGGGTTGVGPCLHHYEFVNRWGGQQPYFTLATTINLESNQLDNGDPIELSPILGPSIVADANNSLAPVTLEYHGVFNTTTTTIATLVAAKNRSTATQLRINIGTGPLTYQLVTNTTRSNSVAFPYAKQTGSWRMTQPLNPANYLGYDRNTTADGAAIVNPTENNSWAATDTITYGSPPSWRFVRLTPDTSYCHNDEVCQIVVDNVLVDLAGGDAYALASPSGQNPGDQSFFVGADVQLFNNVVNPQVVIASPNPPHSSSPQYWWNNVFAGGLAGGFALNSAPAYMTTILGGYIETTAGRVVVNGGLAFDFDVIFQTNSGGTQHATLNGRNLLGTVDNEVTLTSDFGVLDFQQQALGGGPILWGGINCQLDLLGPSLALYPGGPDGGRTAFECTSTNAGLLVSGQAVGCATYPNSPLTTSTCNLSTSPAQLDSLFGVEAGCLGSGPGNLCNYTIP